jgi:DNA invertase Pin-like site-specific DNA recombinase
MARIIRQDARLIEEFVPQQQQLPTDRPIVQYVRQSSLGQVKNNRQSAILQDEALARRLVAYGWKPDDIIKIDIDQGKSGQKRRDEREGLDQLYKLIERKEAGAIAAFDPSRLYRDLTRVYYTDFVSLLETYSIPLVTYSQIFWPSRKDMDGLIDKFKEAANFIDEVINGKLKPAKLQAIESGSYGGGAVPFGFIVAETEERKYFQVYEPHARLIRWLFQRFRELDGNLSRLGAELRAEAFQFPSFTGVERIPHVALRWNGTGYPLRTRDALLSILTNVAYIGWYLYDGVVVSKEAWKPIVEMSDFLFAHRILSSKNLDGSDNEDRPKVERRYGLKTKALLEGLLDSEGRPVYAMSNSQAYEAHTDNDGWKTTENIVSIKDLDSTFSKALIALVSTLELRHRQGLQDSLYERLTELQEEKQEQAVSLETALANIDRAIRQAELDKRVALEEEYETGVRDATKLLKRLHADRDALEDKANQAGREVSELEECADLLECALERWESLPFERQRRFVNLVVERASVIGVAPHIVRLEVTLKEPVNCLLTCHVFRHRGQHAPWTEEEEAVIRRMYTRADRADILHELPERAWKSIVTRAHQMGIPRETKRHDTSGLGDSLTCADAALMQELGMSEEEPHWTVSEHEGCTMISSMVGRSSLNSEKEIINW